MTERDAYLLLSTFIPFGPVHLTHLISFFGSAEKVCQVTKSELVEVGLKESVRDAFLEHVQSFDMVRYKRELEKQSITWITKQEPGYPSNLHSLKDAPFTLYCKGRFVANDIDSIAIVGSRSMSMYGRDACAKLASSLAMTGVTIVSGLALGIDAVAHKAALDAGGRCIAVLASGLDTISPVTNKWIADRIISEKQGIIVSEYPLQTTPTKSNFPSRNRIISGLSRGVIVVEGRIKSGTLHTAKHAADQGRTVFAVPGEITSPTSEVCHYLIRNGATLVTKAEDIIEDLDLQLQTDREAIQKIMPEDEVEERIIAALSTDNLSVDEIVRQTGIEPSIVSSKVTIMTLKGLVQQLADDTYQMK